MARYQIFASSDDGSSNIVVDLNFMIDPLSPHSSDVMEQETEQATKDFALALATVVGFDTPQSGGVNLIRFGEPTPNITLLPVPPG
jgi:hypothetical protein